MEEELTKSELITLRAILYSCYLDCVEIKEQEVIEKTINIIQDKITRL